MSLNPQVVFQQAIQAFNANHFEQVIKLLKPLIKAKSVTPDILNMAGAAYTKLGKFKEAQKQFKASQKLNPKYAQTIYHLGNLSREEGRNELAITQYEKAYKLDKSNPRPLMEAALILQKEESWDQAEVFVDQFMAAGGDAIEGSIRKAVCRYSLYDYAEAESYLEEANKLSPNLPIVRYYQALLYDKTQRKEESEKLYLDLINKQNHQPSLFSLSLLYFSLGRWSEAFAYYDNRPVANNLLIHCKAQGVQSWDGKTSLKGKHVFVKGEQGLGDQIRYLYFLRFLVEDASKVSLICDTRLYPLIEASFPGIECIQAETFRPQILKHINADVALCIGSLGRAYGDELVTRGSSDGMEKFNAASVQIPAQMQASFAGRLPDNGKLNVGVSWRSIRFMKERNEWYLSAQQFAQLLKVLDVNVISLQYGVIEEERVAFEEAGLELVELSDVDLKDDQFGLAAVIDQLDMVVSVSTALSELAGAVGTSSVIFAVEDIKWFMAEPHIRGFYPNTKVCYKQMFGEWDLALEEASAAIQKKIVNRSHQDNK